MNKPGALRRIRQSPRKIQAKLPPSQSQVCEKMSETALLAIIEHYKELCQFENATGKVAVFSRVASELSRYSPKPNAWTWRYIAGIVSGRMKPGKYIVQAIEKLSNEIAGEPKLIPVPACPIPGCEETYIHLHGQATYNPTTQHPTPNRPKRVRTPRNYEGKAWVF